MRDAQTEGENIQSRLVLTGQHYDKNVNDSFFEQLDIPGLCINIEEGGGAQAHQTTCINLYFRIGF